jgi:hypothetical protein
MGKWGKGKMVPGFNLQVSIFEFPISSFQTESLMERRTISPFAHFPSYPAVAVSPFPHFSFAQTMTISPFSDHGSSRILNGYKCCAGAPSLRVLRSAGCGAGRRSRTILNGTSMLSSLSQSGHKGTGNGEEGEAFKLRISNFQFPVSKAADSLPKKGSTP